MLFIVLKNCREEEESPSSSTTECMAVQSHRATVWRYCSLLQYFGLIRGFRVVALRFHEKKTDKDKCVDHYTLFNRKHTHDSMKLRRRQQYQNSFLRKSPTMIKVRENNSEAEKRGRRNMQLEEAQQSSVQFYLYNRKQHQKTTQKK